jgi:hypothetical protein
LFGQFLEEIKMKVKALLIACSSIFAMSVSAMNITTRILLSTKLDSGKAFSAIAHMALAHGMLSQERYGSLTVERTDTSLDLAPKQLKLSYLDTMCDGGNAQQLRATKERSKSELSVLGWLDYERDFDNDGFNSNEIEQNQAFYMIFLKSQRDPAQIIANVAFELGNNMSDSHKDLLAVYEDKEGEVVSVASKYPFVAMTAKSLNHLNELEDNLKRNQYDFVKGEGVIGFFNKNKNDKSLTKKFSLAK